eukprot:scaffold50_cov420-Prasinococcus_capsulatus_cf.AAC.42
MGHVLSQPPLRAHLCGRLLLGPCGTGDLVAWQRGGPAPRASQAEATLQALDSATTLAQLALPPASCRIQALQYTFDISRHDQCPSAAHSGRAGPRPPGWSGSRQVLGSGGASVAAAAAAAPPAAAPPRACGLPAARGRRGLPAARARWAPAWQAAAAPAAGALRAGRACGRARAAGRECTPCGVASGSPCSARPAAYAAPARAAASWKVVCPCHLATASAADAAALWAARGFPSRR